MALFADDFRAEVVQVGETTVFLRRGGQGPALVLLHGFPETHVAWRAVASLLARQFTVILPDLPGYGDSTGPEPDLLHERYSKRAMAATIVEAMSKLGLSTFAVVGHDRGARVAYRLALDHPKRVSALAVLDIIPTLDMAERMTYETARQMANWFLLAMPSPVPEDLIARNANDYLEYIVDAWGGSDVIAPEAFAEYARCFRNPRTLRGICEEYRAGDTVDIEYDRADRVAARRITCPLLALWQKDGLMEQFGDPLTIWRVWADTVTGDAIPGGHFMMEESPERIAGALRQFLK
jgi:haloacetate dehalogenase